MQRIRMLLQKKLPKRKFFAPIFFAQLVDGFFEELVSTCILTDKNE